MRTVDWVDGAVAIIDQTVLPATERPLRLSTVDEVVAAIARLAGSLRSFTVFSTSGRISSSRKRAY